ncbi:unnamed protein product [Schistosoma turkestanicum]|nr:unnamed protein product [Schistosoma turkestanicum]
MQRKSYSYSSVLRQQRQHLEDSMPDLSVQLEKPESPVLSCQKSLREKEIEIELAKLKLQEVEKRLLLEMLLRERCPQNSSERGDMRRDTCPTTNYVERFFELPKPEIRRFDGNQKEYWIFTKGFQKVVEQATTDDAIRSNYLMQFCTV